MIDAKTGASPIAVRWLPVDSLTPDERNARVHPERQVARIAESIAAFGFNVPILIDAEGVVVAGHGRLLAARRLGLDEVPTIALDHLDAARRRAFMIADNRLGELAAWDEGLLAVELEELKRLDLDFTLSATGFELGEVDLTIAANPYPHGPSGDGPPSGRPMAGDAQAASSHAFPAVRPHSRNRPPRVRPADGAGAVDGGGLRMGRSAVARPGDTWALGPHRLACAAAPAGTFFAIDAAIRRWQALAGDSARLHPGGPTFDSIAAARRGGEGAAAANGPPGGAPRR